MIPPFCLGEGSSSTDLTPAQKAEWIARMFAHLDRPLRRVLLLPPDHTRLNSDAGTLCNILWERLTADGVTVHLLPALGTHAPMTEAQLRMMFGERIPLSAFLVHDWRNNVRHLGEIPSERLQEWSEGKLDCTVQVMASNYLYEGYDLIISVGQIVPHEVVGMANYTKNILVGVGGVDTINKSHFLGAVYGMERVMGRADTPVRRLFNYGVDTFLGDLPIVYLLTVMQKDFAHNRMAMRGLYMGAGPEAFETGAKLAVQANLDLLDRPMKKAVVYLDPHEFKSTWLGNKAIYRTRMAMADAGELIILAPALREFGEDPEIDRLIRKYGYHGTPNTLQAVADQEELRSNLSAAAHLIHGSSEGRFTITYCPGPGMARAAVEAVGFNSGDLDAMLARYNPDVLRDGLNVLPDGEEVFYISNPALGLWALKAQF
jgi:nickel-dependent lactate racemase